MKSQWERASRTKLKRTLDEVRAQIERVAVSKSGDLDPVFSMPFAGPSGGPRIIVPVTCEDEGNEAAALDQLAKVCSLSAFERSLLLLCAGVELAPDFPELCARANGDSRLRCATLGLATEAFADAEWSALTPSSTLRRWRLIEVGNGDSLTTSPLKIDERILHYLLGVSYLDERLQGLIEPCPAPTRLPESQKSVVRIIARMWSDETEIEPAVLQLCGNDPAGKRSVAAHVAAAFGMQLRGLRARDLPSAYAERDAFARLWEREAMLSNCALLIDDEDSDLESARRVLPFLESNHAFLMVMGREPLWSRRRRILRVEVDRPSAVEQKTIWQEALGDAVERLNGQLDSIARQFDFSVQAISVVTNEALQQSKAEETDDFGSMLWEACRRQARPRMDDLAHRISPTAKWEDLVLPAAQLQVLRTIAAHVRQRTRVYDEWGFAGKGLRGLGISALFSGASGTGKTMAAEVLANELRLDLYRIDLSSLVSKYIGETEKNLRRVFDAAEEGGAILLFDEADALFGKRSEVKDSHDRYANIEVSYLLQRIEAYRGLAILTSNLKNSIDPGFMRRLRFIVHFPFPDAQQRMEIWRRIFPAAVPTEKLSLEKLARLNIAGGNIRNLALNAAFLAAESGEPVRMKHLLLATRCEYMKLEKALSETDVAGWV